MQKSNQAKAKAAAQQALVNLALLSLASDVTPEEAATILRLLKTDGGSTAETETGITVAADQVKVRGAGRRPPSLVGREVVVTATWRVVREQENGRITVALVGGEAVNRQRKAARAKRAKQA
jgi:hypothetical protein